ncbi:MAG: electron transfer flavoprotein subunit alpha/FixB family protein [Arthrobacter sp.]|uniref:electron transfer flavoprotein subunit alpha/FixB family protein n=1 Tax=unclassified Arthrobacter TaxID=235627 RepID=UPI00264D31BB|nr:electron transfer flavoprotein subunit alpha/FixB family protein [Micrococcaceae bacterium]MDN5811926.1 electron transfer flavoprotein subunit alpha/FixB family protein [Micrococcaceae bacterium]MDN5825030.1 electron transfer flavoprotein subunit alpha/FixB family protein [Micrococcaceae bacterium]MDN5880451.1 electron transfer flavoprotein subunit alpha/FixB family protein [Micrococcaceae bacterium]MDN5887967.1 electron transfer flavoprotein subunit alpha/FixB family protein [Micrococcaceae
MANILVFIDTPTAQPGKAQRELLTLGHRLGEPVVALGSPAADETVAAYANLGATALYAPAGALAGTLIAGEAAFVAEAARACSAGAVLLPNSADGKEIAARVGIKLSAGVITDAVDVTADLTVTKSVLAGGYTVNARAVQGTPVITVKPNSVEPTDAAATSPEVTTLEVADAGPAARVTETVEKAVSARPELQDARIVVSGGRGLDGDFTPVEQLADALGAAVGASRAATDAGWIEHSYQVGQTGKTISPQLYICAGISGAIQHKAGMQTSQVIVAINSDEDAPIFEIADFGIVGDARSVLPQAAAEIQRRKG